MPVKVTPEQYAQKQADRLKGSVELMRQGIERVSVAPGQKAAAKSAKWTAAMTSQATQEKWKRNVAAVSLESWKTAMTNKGIGRVAVGIDNAHDKVVNFATKLIAHQNAGLATLEKLPDLTLEDSIQRATTWIRHMANFKG